MIQYRIILLPLDYSPMISVMHYLPNYYLMWFIRLRSWSGTSNHLWRITKNNLICISIKEGRHGFGPRASPDKGDFYRERIILLRYLELHFYMGNIIHDSLSRVTIMRRERVVNTSLILLRNTHTVAVRSCSISSVKILHWFHAASQQQCLRASHRIPPSAVFPQNRLAFFGKGPIRHSITKHNRSAIECLNIADQSAFRA